MAERWSGHSGRRRCGTKSKTPASARTGLSGAGKQQRLCIARALARAGGSSPGRACSALDPGATQRIEELLVELKQSYSILIGDA